MIWCKRDSFVSFSASAALAALIVSITFFAGCNRKAAKEAKLKKGLHSIVFLDLETEVRNKLKDPESARFRNEVLYRQPLAASPNDPINGILYLCGEVNAKNSYGGYTGADDFIAMLTVQTVHEAPLMDNRYVFFPPSEQAYRTFFDKNKARSCQGGKYSD